MDVALVWDQGSAHGDWTTAGGGIALGPAIVSAVVLSLFTDRIASPDFVPTDGTADRRGWWGDSYEPSPIGSRLWQLDRAAKSTAANLPKLARGYCVEALQWLLDDGVAASVSVTAGWASPTALAILVTVAEPDGRLTTFNAQYAWAGV